MNRLSHLIGHLEPSPSQTASNPCSAKGEIDQSLLLKNNSSNKSQFFYTLDATANSVFTTEQREFYDKNGYIVIKKLFSFGSLSLSLSLSLSGIL